LLHRKQKKEYEIREGGCVLKDEKVERKRVDLLDPFFVVNHLSGQGIDMQDYL
jgi:hypothetical protein